MNNYFIYLAGGMTGLSYSEQVLWRNRVKRCLEDSYDCDMYNVCVINPADYFNFEETKHITEKEIVNFDLHKLRNSNLVIVNFNDPKSLGTMAELAIAYEHRIPVIGLNEENKKLHPWQYEFCERIFDDFDEMLDYVEDIYLR